MRILVTGGAGYVGSVLVHMLLGQGYSVRVLDNLMYGGRGLLPCFADRRFEFIRGDIREEEPVRGALDGVDLIIHLAAIVGFPACKKDPRLAEEVNVLGTKNLDRLRSRDQLMIFASTGSNYGAVAGDLCTEESPLSPLTVYGQTKTEAERYLLDSGNAICLRFATAFGVSNRMRLDLLINDFVYRAIRERNLIIYEKSYKRSFIHVRDMGRSFVFAIEQADRMRDNAYNVGSESMNYSKEDVALKIRERIEFYLHFADIGRDEDQRNYEVSYEKIRRLGFSTTLGVDEGIDELIRALQVVEVKNEFLNV
ncbi:MAG: NAD-dependent epimerase/dehydratase family protein [Candidatus Methylomirabilales bacterium]